MSRLSKHDVGLLVVSLIWGANYSITKQALAHISPLTFAALRFVLSTGLLWLVVWSFRLHRPMARSVRLKLLGWGVIGHTLNQLAFLSGLKLTTATNSALIFGSLPVVVALLGVVMGYERPRPRVWLGIFLGTAGVAIVVGAEGVHFSGATRWGDLFSVLALLFWALFTVGVRQVALGHNSAQVAALTHLGGTPFLLVVAAPFATGTPWPFHGNVWLALLYSSVFSSVVAAVLWTRSLKALGGSRTALYNCLTPLVAAIVAWIILGERPAPIQAVGAALVIVGVLVSRAPAAEAER